MLALASRSPGPTRPQPFSPISTFHPVHGDCRLVALVTLRRRTAIPPASPSLDAQPSGAGCPDALTAGSSDEVHRAVRPSRSFAQTPSAHASGPSAGAEPSEKGPSASPELVSQIHAWPSSE